MSLINCFKDEIFINGFIVVSPVVRGPLTKSVNEPNLGAADRGGSLHLMVSELGFKVYETYCVVMCLMCCFSLKKVM